MAPGAKQARKAGAVRAVGSYTVFADLGHNPPYLGSRCLPKTAIVRLVALDFC